MTPQFFRATPFAPVYAAAGLTALDIGSRGGFDRDLLPIAWAVDGVGFEPEPAAFAKLGPDPGPWRSMRWLPTAIGPSTGTATLNVPPDANGGSLLVHDPEIGRRFGLEHLTQDCRQIMVETVTLADAIARWELPPPAYLKLDVEGAELAILDAAGGALDSLVAIKTEASFIPARLGQPLATDLIDALDKRGFVVMDILEPARWRRRPVAPAPYSWAGDPAFSRGQLAQCDLLFFRDPVAIAAEDADSALRAALVAMALGYFDHALALFERPVVTQVLTDRHGLTFRPALARASRDFGRRAALAAIRRILRDLIPLARSLTMGVPG